MKKLFMFMAAALMTFSLASCDKKDKNEPETPAQPQDELTFKIEVSEITAMSAFITVTPSKDDVAYYWSYVSQDALDYYKMTVEEYCDDDMKYYLGQGYKYDDLVDNNLIVTGKDEYPADELIPETKYYVYACTVDKDLKITSAITIAEFTTKKFEIIGDQTLDLSSKYAWSYVESAAMGLLQIMGEDQSTGSQVAIAVLTDETANGSYTIEDIYEPYADYGFYNYYNYIYNKDEDLDVTFVSLAMTAEVNESDSVLAFSGEVVGNNGIRYLFENMQAEKYQENQEGGGEGAPARKAAAKKAHKAFKPIKK